MNINIKLVEQEINVSISLFPTISLIWINKIFLKVSETVEPTFQEWERDTKYI